MSSVKEDNRMQNAGKRQNMENDLQLEIEQLIKNMQKEIKEEGHTFEETIYFEEEAFFQEGGQPDVNEERVFIPDPHLHYDHPLNSSKKSIRRVVIFVKRLIRKTIRFLIVPILDEQAGFNYSVKAEMERLDKILAVQEKRLRRLEKRRKEL